MELTVDVTNIKSKIKHLNKEWEFNGIVKQYIEFEDCIAIMLCHPEGKQFNNNVFIIYRNGDITTVKKIVEESGEPYTDDWFTTIVAVNSKTLQLWAYRGVDFSIDLEKKNIVRQEYAR